jgi:hypothetical protein
MGTIASLPLPSSSPPYLVFDTRALSFSMTIQDPGFLAFLCDISPRTVLKSRMPLQVTRQCHHNAITMPLQIALSCHLSNLSSRSLQHLFQAVLLNSSDASSLWLCSRRSQHCAYGVFVLSTSRLRASSPPVNRLIILSSAPKSTILV